MVETMMAERCKSAWGFPIVMVDKKEEGHHSVKTLGFLITFTLFHSRNINRWHTSSSITLLPYYQAKENIEMSGSFLLLISTTFVWWVYGKPLIRKFSNLTPQAIPDALGPLGKICLKELSNKLDSIGKVDVPIENQ